VCDLKTREDNMAEVRSTSPDKTPSYYSSPVTDLKSSLVQLSGKGQSVKKSESLTINDAMQWVVDGKLNADDFYQQLPLPLKSFLDEMAKDRHGTTFQRIIITDQKQLVQVLLQVAQQTSASSSVSENASMASRSKVASKSVESLTAMNPERSVTRRPGLLSVLVIALVGTGSGAYWLVTQRESPMSDDSLRQQIPTIISQSDSAAQGESVNAKESKSNAATSPSLIDSLERRTWTDRKNRQISATLVGYRRGSVDLRNGQGNVESIPLDNLSQADRAFLWQLASSNETEIHLFQPRVWTAAKNAAQVTAAVIQFEANSVHLMRSDGRIFTAPNTTFSQADQEYLQTLAAGL